jgi:hypothetical protein
MLKTLKDLVISKIGVHRRTFQNSGFQNLSINRKVSTVQFYLKRFFLEKRKQLIRAIFNSSLLKGSKWTWNRIKKAKLKVI